ncbi:ricin-type beta-trefoil lectin domain protein [Amycolatopsis sp. H6(2020)]|nr:ricin-type beta-trefoil lectin domain protein [Amycolatopsis sp. H6(2020)]
MTELKSLRALLAAVVAVVGLVLGTSTASAAPDQTLTTEYYGYFMLVDGGTGWCLDGNGSAVYTNPCDRNNTWQTWYINGATVMHAKSSTCLQWTGQGNAAVTRSCNGSGDQSWHLWNLPTGICHVFTGEPQNCLDSNAQHAAYFNVYNGGPYQSWTLQSL